MVLKRNVSLGSVNSCDMADNQKKMSGAQFRKRKLEKELSLAKQVGSFEKYLRPNPQEPKPGKSTGDDVKEESKNPPIESCTIENPALFQK